MNKNNILLVDIGNSSVKWSLFDNSSLLENNKANALLDMRQLYYPKNISSSFFSNYWDDLNKPERVIVSCVANKDVLHALGQACEQLWNIEATEINSTNKEAGIVNAYIEPADLGSDRWCAMIGANQIINTDFIVVDCGSAITIDVVSSQDKILSKHIGGYILPGLEMMKQSLGTNTADVKIDLKNTNTSLAPSNTTIGCVNSAVYLSAVKLIETVFEQQLKQSDGVQCFLTGGDAALLAEFLSIEYSMVADLVLRGLAVIDLARIENKNN